jgi:histidinol-phosphatase
MWRTRAYGDFWSYMLVAEGAVDVAAEPELEIYDMAALVAIVEEAGGRFTSLEGKRGPWGGNAVASNGLLHDEVLARLAPDA